jgi:hypothetical protein
MLVATNDEQSSKEPAAKQEQHRLKLALVFWYERSALIVQ